jgi:DNA-binding NarL/FixJ family response regulator
MPIKILIADDDALVREGLKIILEMDERFEVVGCVENGLKAVEFCCGQQVDVALLDVRMPVMDGLQAAKEISSGTSSTRPLILTTFDDDEFIFRAVKNGAKGYMLKNTPPERMKNAIVLVNEGGTVMQDVVLDKIREKLDSVGSSRIDTGMFSEREMEIIKLISKGLSNREIAAELFISEGTVKNYITSILNKTGFEHRTQIAVYYLNRGKI